MQDIIWFGKEKKGNYGKKCDITIQTRKATGKISITFRNRIYEEITNTEHVRVGLSANDKNKLFFMAADSVTGWKLSPTSAPKSEYANAGDNKQIVVGEEKLIDALIRFEGDYNAEISDDNLIYIDRRSVL